MPQPNIPFEWGRVDCSTTPTSDEEGPEAEPDMTRQELMDTFKVHFGFEPQQVI